MNPPDPRDHLSETLQAWRVTPSANPNFRPSVWQRIRQGAPATWASHLVRHRVAWSVAAGVAIFAASVAGHAFGRATLDSRREQMVVSYLGNLDPRVLAKLRP
jgi:hypothetical protein